MMHAVEVVRPLAPVAARRGFTDLQRRFHWYCLWPTLVVLGVVALAPTLYLLATSLTPLNLTRPETAWNFSNPLGNYALLLSDARFRGSLWVQVKLSIWTVALQLLVGFLFALVLNVRSRLLEALRTVLLIPMVLPPIVVAIIWKVLYTPDISPVHQALAALGWPIPALITHPDYALMAIVVADVWEWFPFTMLMVLAALQMLPQEQVDAARIDGAGAWQLTVHIVLPFLRGVLLVAALFRLIDSIKAFPLIFILTDGGPGTVTEVTNFYSYIQAFNFSYLGYSSAITVVLVAATILLSWIIIRVVGWGAGGE
ncbi:MAG: sugar ABC transporter permease [Candidatus Rokubacteria bacterium]|nr:sugar ABC transporter permease [Candidatus Rokubacteria bacterium]